MSKRHALDRQRRSLGEIGEILGSMKTLAYMETRKLARFLRAEEQVVESIEEAAADFLSFEPALLPTSVGAAVDILLIGSERGFCGDFNRALVEHVARRRAAGELRDSRIIVVGHKLKSMLEGDKSVVAFIDGASVAEDVRLVVNRLVQEVEALRTTAGLTCIYHESDQLVEETLVPPFAGQATTGRRFANPPLLNLPPAEFLLELIDHFLLAKINHVLNTSLMAENTRRVTHLENAVRHLSEQSAELNRKSRSLRQEEIVEEIEVILINASALDH
jgi:F-type H+-transporting ATPase subunit gamma